jgi:hypothetical protein
MKRRIGIALVCLLAGIGPVYGAVENSTKRFGLFIGSNNGGRNRATLRYAVSDARAVSRVFSEMGGIGVEDNILLIEPNIREINRRIGALHDRILDSKGSHKRTELVFYYSGHSDEAGLLLNRESYGYKELREHINTIPADMRIVILDSCSSGAFTRIKGGVKTQPFLIDDSVSAEGYAFLTSSSASEASQESDSIASSYFTHSLVTGLRGAADTVGDGRVTLNEVYRFAYSETLAKTETSIFGAQHPSYDMQVSGAGDVVLTDIKETSASLLIDENILGRLSIRDSSDHLVAEITKTAVKGMELGLEPGLYRITLQRGDNFSRAEVLLVKDQRTPLVPADFQLIAAAQAAARGDSPAAGPSEDPSNRPTDDPLDGSEAPEEREGIKGFNFQFVPGLSIVHTGSRNSSDHVLLGILMAQGHGLEGAGLAPIGVSNDGAATGVQAAGIYNIIDGNLQGLQAAGIFNIARGSMTGVQAAGIFNIAGGSVTGVRAAGIFNIAGGSMIGVQSTGIFSRVNDDFKGVQASGIFNYTGGEIRGIQAAGILNMAQENFYGLQAGLVNLTRKNFYGLQAGLVNIGGKGSGVQAGLVNSSQNEKIIPIGLVNIVKEGILHPAVYVDSMEFLNFSFRSGSRHFYSIIGVGAQKIYLSAHENDKAVWGWNKDDTLLAWRGGLGFEFPIKSMFITIDVSGGSVLNLDTIARDGYDSSVSRLNQARLTAGYKFFKHLGVFAGISYDYIHLEEKDSPNPAGKAEYVFGWGDSRNINKLGFFAGLQF